MQSLLTIRPATSSDIPFIMSVEQIPGYAERVGAFTVEQHQQKMGLKDHRYYIGSLKGQAVGFAVVKCPDDGMGIANLNRIAVAEAGRGTGSTFVRAIQNLVFSDPDIDRLWLDVLTNNEIAQHVYEKLGFAREGIMRSALRYPDGRRADLILMAIIREDWRQICLRQADPACEEVNA